MSIADVLYFWEINTVEQHLQRELINREEHPYLARWYHESMKTIKEFQEIERKSTEMMANYNKKPSAAGQ